MNRIIRRATSRLSVSGAATLIAGTSVVGLILGIVRTNLLNAHFNHFSTGAYFVAFKIPDFIFYTLAAGALSVAFIPVLADKLAAGERQAAWRLTSSVLNLIALVMLFVCLILIAFPRPIVELIAPGFSDQQLDVSAQIMRLVSINPMIFAISSIFASYQQVFGRFFFTAVAPLLYNIAIIASIYLFKDSMGIVGLGVGVALGAAGYLLFMASGMSRLRFRYRPLIDFRAVEFKSVVKLLPIRSLDQGLTYLNSIIQTRFASGISIHAVTNFENALLLYNAPVSLIGWAIGTAAFPHFAKRMAQGRRDLFKLEFLIVLRMMIWLAIPIVVISFFGREYLARIISPRDSSEIALILAFFCLGILFRMVYLIVSRFYYAQKDIKITLKVTAIAIVTNLVLAWWLSRPDRLGVVGLALSATLVSLLEVGILVGVLVYRDRGLFSRQFLRGLVPMAEAGLLSAIVGGLIFWLLPLSAGDSGLGLLLKLGLVSCLTFAFYTGLSYWLLIEEAHRLLRRLQKLVLHQFKF